MLKSIMGYRDRRFFYAVLVVFFVFLYFVGTITHFKVSLLEKRSFEDENPDGSHQKQVNTELL